MHPLLPKTIVYSAIAIAAILLLLSRRVRPWNRVALQIVALLLLGGAGAVLLPSLGLHPSPLCALARLAEMTIVKGFAPPLLLLSLALILGFSLVAKKLFCGWICPLGALQEAIHAIPSGRKVPNLPFAFTNTIRAYLLGVCLLGLLLYKIYLFDHINAFELLHWDLDYTTATLGIGVIALASLLYYRPYCNLLCPIGFVTWLLERVAFLGVRIDPARCNSCGACERKVPCAALAPLLERGDRWIPDCTSCGLCIDACPKGVITFGPRFPSARPTPDATPRSP